MVAQSGTASSTMNEIEMYLFTDDSPEEFLISLIEKYGSVELGICVSSHASSKKLLGALQAVTNGFLVMNAVYLDNQRIRVPEASERDFLEKDWKMPFRWLSPGPSAGEEPGSGSKASGRPAGELDLVLRKHGIKAFLIAGGHSGMMEQMNGAA